jgi:hypothetical protein
MDVGFKSWPDRRNGRHSVAACQGVPSMRQSPARRHEDVVLGKDRCLVGVEVQWVVIVAAALTAVASFVVVCDFVLPCAVCECR